MAHLVTIDRESDISALLARPEFFPLRIDPQRRAVVFVQMSRETLRRSSFLDHRTILAGPDTSLVDLDALFQHLSSRPVERPTHFILHGAGCGARERRACDAFDRPHAGRLARCSADAAFAQRCVGFGSPDQSTGPGQLAREPSAQSGWGGEDYFSRRTASCVPAFGAEVPGTPRVASQPGAGIALAVGSGPLRGRGRD